MFYVNTTARNGKVNSWLQDSNWKCSLLNKSRPTNRAHCDDSVNTIHGTHCSIHNYSGLICKEASLWFIMWLSCTERQTKYRRFWIHFKDVSTLSEQRPHDPDAMCLCSHSQRSTIETDKTFTLPPPQRVPRSPTRLLMSPLCLRLAT